MSTAPSQLPVIVAGGRIQLGPNVSYAVDEYQVGKIPVDEKFRQRFDNPCAVTLGEALRTHTTRIVLSCREMGRIDPAKGVEHLVRNDLWCGRSAERFYDAMEMEWLYGWNVGNCLDAVQNNELHGETP